MKRPTRKELIADITSKLNCCTTYYLNETIELLLNHACSMPEVVLKHGTVEQFFSNPSDRFFLTQACGVDEWLKSDYFSKQLDKYFV